MPCPFQSVLMHLARSGSSYNLYNSKFHLISEILKSTYTLGAHCSVVG
jgi:hypothetical protein